MLFETINVTVCNKFFNFEVFKIIQAENNKFKKLKIFINCLKTIKFNIHVFIPYQYYNKQLMKILTLNRIMVS